MGWQVSRQILIQFFRMPQEAIRNVAIIAHVDHGKTTLVDGLLKQSNVFRSNEAAMSQELIMDSNDQERERGITILAKNTAVQYQGVKINIIDTPGHADFGGEVERVLGMADGVVLVVDAQEGPMPQTKAVLKKAFLLGLKPIVVINKIDKRDARIDWVIERTHDLFLDLATDMEQLEFPLFYAIGRAGKAWAELPANPDADANLEPLFEAILKYVPAPQGDPTGPFQMVISNLEADSFQGTYLIGRINRGSARPGLSVALLKANDSVEQGRIDRVYVSQGLKRVEVESAIAGDIVALTGVKGAGIGETIADPAMPEALPTITIEEPTLKMTVSANTSPFAGREGQFVTSRQLLDRIQRELATNVSMRLNDAGGGNYVLSGRGELHLAVFIENLRREGYELQVGKPEVILKEVDGKQMEPVEELTIDVADEYVGAITGEVGRRRGLLIVQSPNADGTTRLLFEIATRGILGLRSALLVISRGTAQMSSSFLRYDLLGAPIPKLRNGVLVASETGKAFSYGLETVQNRGIPFIGPGTDVYEGMIIGQNSREDDMEINVAKEKKQTNVRSNADIATVMTPPTIFSLEQWLNFLEEDELLEATPKSLRGRKRLLNGGDRQKARKN
jgi:GTP-binding protein